MQGGACSVHAVYVQCRCTPRAWATVEVIVQVDVVVGDQVAEQRLRHVLVGVLYLVRDGVLLVQLLIAGLRKRRLPLADGVPLCRPVRPSVQGTILDERLANGAHHLQQRVPVFVGERAAGSLLSRMAGGVHKLLEHVREWSVADVVHEACQLHT